jgi:hypothetical protein
MEILPVAVGRLADAIAAPAAEDPVDLADQPFRLVEPALFAGLAEQRYVENEAEGVRSEIAEAIRPDALAAHPVQLSGYVIEVTQGQWLRFQPAND